MECKICYNVTDNKLYNIREMMYGTEEVFQYLYCPACNSLQLNNPPEDTKKYYPSNYYAYPSKFNMLKNYLQVIRNKYHYYQKGIAGRLALLFLGKTEFIELLGDYNLELSSKILDVGCGNGRLLKSMRDIGFKNLIGIDPFLEGSYEDLGRLKIHNVNILQLENLKFDFIMMHHSFEHMFNPLLVLQKAHELLEPDGLLLIRIPVLDGKVWQIYKENWVQIDSPRHLFIHSKNSIELLAKKSNLKIINIKFDSSSFQFWGSEQYKNDIGLHDEKSYLIAPAKSMFTSREIKKFQLESVELNNKKMGDQAAFLLAKAR